MNKTFFAQIKRRPYLWALALAGIFWLIYVGWQLLSRFAAPMDTSRPVLISADDETILVRAKEGEKAQTVYKTRGAIAPWKNGLIVWDKAKHHLLVLLPDQTPRVVSPKPSVKAAHVFSLEPAPNAVYLNLSDSGDKILRVDLTSGAAQTLPQIRAVRSSETSQAVAYLTVNDEIVIHRADGTTRKFSGLHIYPYWQWDYDAARDAVIWLEADGVHYDSPAQSWVRRSTFLVTDYGLWFNGNTGDIFLQKSGQIRTGIMDVQGVQVIGANADNKVWRWNDDGMPSGGQMAELSPEQETLLRTLPAK